MNIIQKVQKLSEGKKEQVAAPKARLNDAEVEFFDIKKNLSPEVSQDVAKFHESYPQLKEHTIYRIMKKHDFKFSLVDSELKFVSSLQIPRKEQWTTSNTTERQQKPVEAKNKNESVPQNQQNDNAGAKYDGRANNYDNERPAYQKYNKNSTFSARDSYYRDDNKNANNDYYYNNNNNGTYRPQRYNQNYQQYNNDANDRYYQPKYQHQSTDFNYYEAKSRYGDRWENRHSEYLPKQNNKNQAEQQQSHTKQEKQRENAENIDNVNKGYTDKKNNTNYDSADKHVQHQDPVETNAKSPEQPASRKQSEKQSTNQNAENQSVNQQSGKKAASHNTPKSSRKSSNNIYADGLVAKGLQKIKTVCYNNLNSYFKYMLTNSYYVDYKAEKKDTVDVKLEVSNKKNTADGRKKKLPRGNHFDTEENDEESYIKDKKMNYFLHAKRFESEEEKLKSERERTMENQIKELTLKVNLLTAKTTKLTDELAALKASNQDFKDNNEKASAKDNEVYCMVPFNLVKDLLGPVVQAQHESLPNGAPVFKFGKKE